MQNNNY